VIAAPLLYERIWLASTRQLSMLIRTIINHYGKPLSVATWIQDLDVTCLNDTMDEWEGIYTLIRHTTALATIELGEPQRPCHADSILRVHTHPPLLDAFTFSHARSNIHL
jgi:hypothetical protein